MDILKTPANKINTSNTKKYTLQHGKLPLDTFQVRPHKNNSPIIEHSFYTSYQRPVPQMFKNMMKYLGKEDSIQAYFSKNDLLTDSTSSLNLLPLMHFYRSVKEGNQEEALVKYLIGLLEKKKHGMVLKLKTVVFLLFISKSSNYDISDLLMSRKIKLFSEDSVKKKITHTFEITSGNKEEYVHKFFVIPLYNYMIKLSVNEELYETCKSGEVPFDDIFRKGTKIRYVWVFKVYNLLNLLMPIVPPLIEILQKFPQDEIFLQLLVKVCEDITFYTNFISRCLEETLGLSNPLLLPYADLLQFFESIKQYNILREKLQRLMPRLKKYIAETSIKLVHIDDITYKEIEVVAMRIQLISVSLRSNNPKENERLATEYNDKVQKYEHRLKTEGNDDDY